MLHLSPVRLTCLGEKVGSAVFTLRASQGQREWGNNKWSPLPLHTSPTVCTLLLPCLLPPAALLWSRCHVSGGCLSSHFVFSSRDQGINREDAPEGETSHFHRERGEAVTEPGSGICGTVPPAHVGQKKRQILRTYSVLQPADVIPFQPHRGLNDRTTFQQDSGWNTPLPSNHATRTPPPPPQDRLHGIRTNRLMMVPWIGYKEAPLKVQPSLIKKKKKIKYIYLDLKVMIAR